MALRRSFLDRELIILPGSGTSCYEILSQGARGMERSQGHHHTRPTTCAAPVVQPPAILPPSHSRHCQDGHRIHVLIVVPSIAACIATALSKARKSSRILSGSMSGFGPRSLQRIDSARRQTLWIFTLTWCGGFAQTRVKGFCVMTLSPPTHLRVVRRSTHIIYSSSLSRSLCFTPWFTIRHFT